MQMCFYVHSDLYWPQLVPSRMSQEKSIEYVVFWIDITYVL